MGSLPIGWLPGQLPGWLPGGAGSEPRVSGQVRNHGFRGRFRGTGFHRDGSRTVLARFRKKAYDL